MLVISQLDIDLHHAAVLVHLIPVHLALALGTVYVGYVHTVQKDEGGGAQDHVLPKGGYVGAVVNGIIVPVYPPQRGGWLNVTS